MIDNSYLQGVTFYTQKGTRVTNRRNIKLIHVNTKLSLHSHGIGYWYSSGWEITGYWARDNNDWFNIETTNGSEITNGSTVYFNHLLTNSSINIVSNMLSPITRQLLCRGSPNNRSPAFQFRIEVVNSFNLDNNLNVGDIVRFVNVGTNATLHSHGLRLRSGSYQQEVTGFQARDSNDFWVVIEAN
jgi:dolichyl-phosphate-mannose--protein O-mannosyl transferase